MGFDGELTTKNEKRKTTNAPIKPAALRPGDRVGIVAPASAIERAALVAGCDALRALGYDPVYEESILAAELYFAGSVERRARELHDMFLRDDVRGIVCARGGYGCNYLLPKLDVELIRRNSKVFAGYSDVTTLLTWMHDTTGLVTFHAPMAVKDFAIVQGVDAASWQAGVAGKSEFPVTLPLTAMLPGQAEGKLYGGCLSMLAASLGTPYEIRTEDAILFVEDVACKPYQIDRMLMQLKLAGKLAEVRGIVFGIMRDCAAPAGASYDLCEVLHSVVADLGIPVAFGLNSGHVESNNLTLPLGIRATLTVEGGTAALQLLEPAVSLD